MPTSSSSSPQRCVDRDFPGVQEAAGQRPLRGMRSQVRRPAAQQESGATGYVEHRAVERLRRRPPGGRVVDGCRIHPVLAGLGVDEDHRDGGVPFRRVVTARRWCTARCARNSSRSASSKVIVTA